MAKDHGQKHSRSSSAKVKLRTKTELTAPATCVHTCDNVASLVGGVGTDDCHSFQLKERNIAKDHDLDDKSTKSCKMLNLKTNTFPTWEHSSVKKWSALTVLTLMSFITRLYKIDKPPHVCWDETHFGKMGSWYINRTFFFDVHPPLGKMLIGLSGVLTGYNGSFPFDKPGDKYGNIPYVGMRLFCGSLGACLVPLCFSIVWTLSRSMLAASLAAIFIIFDTGVLTLTRYILLDPILLFFIMSSTLCIVQFQAYHNRPFSFPWWFWLSVTGFFLACSIGVKFVGLFVILLVGVSTVLDLWEILGTLTLSMTTVVRHFLARAMCLIALPAILYLAFFAIHFKVLCKSGSGDGFFSAVFQSQLEGNPLHNASMPEVVAYGSVVTMKNYRTGGAYLHSHWHLYPEGLGARQQQVTTYGHKDDNNMWLVKRFDRDPDKKEDPEFVKHGDFVRLEHVATRRNLHSHRVPAPVTFRHLQVTCYGENGTGDSNDVFRVDITGAQDKENLRTVRSTFRLVHVNAGCALHSHSKQLPKWGWEQFEVTCNPNVRGKNTQWNIEGVTDARLPNRSFEVYAPSFWEKFVESHAVMLQGNSGLKPKEGEVTSQPWQWPINFRGQPFSGQDHRVYLLGNPVLWWGSLASIFVFTSLYLYHAIRMQRGCLEKPGVREYREERFRACRWLLLGWGLHYVPFWSMGRVLYFHHYFPAVLFSFMITGLMVDYLLEMLRQSLKPSLSWTIYHSILGTVIAVTLYSFQLFSPLSYGMKGPMATNMTSDMYGLKWLESWDF